MLPLPRPLRALLLDLDGTLLDRDAALRAWLRRRAGLAGREIDELLAIDARDEGLLAELALVLIERRPGLARDALALAQRIREELPDELRPDPAVTRALDRFAAEGLRLALVSTGGPTQRRKLERAGIAAGRFATLVISGEVGLTKPDPRVFGLACERLALAAHEVLMVGDSPRHDVAGAHAAGIASAWIARGRAWSGSSPAPTLIVEQLGELVERLFGAPEIKIP